MLSTDGALCLQNSTKTSMVETFSSTFLGFCLGQQRPYCHNYAKFQLCPYILFVNDILYTLVCTTEEISYTNINYIILFYVQYIS